MEHEKCKTVTFDVFLTYEQHFYSTPSDDTKLKILEPYFIKERNQIQLQEFDHITDPLWSILTRLPVDQIHSWKLGNMISWDYDQLHCSTNFAKFDIIKKCIILVIH
jgi:hypothetical protein